MTQLLHRDTPFDAVDGSGTGRDCARDLGSPAAVGCQRSLLRQLEQPVAPVGDALAGAGAHEQEPRRRVHVAEVGHETVEVEVEVREEIDLVDDDHVARPEHHRVLERLLLALGDRRDHRPRVLADVELGRTDEVAHVLDDEQVELVRAAGG